MIRRTRRQVGTYVRADRPISTHGIKEGKLDDFRDLSREMTPMIEEGKPNTVFFQAYLNEEGNEVTIVHVFPGIDLVVKPQPRFGFIRLHSD